MPALRRAVVALVAAGALARALRLRAGAAPPPEDDGWRELTSNDFGG